MKRLLIVGLLVAAPLKGALAQQPESAVESLATAFEQILELTRTPLSLVRAVPAR